MLSAMSCQCLQDSISDSRMENQRMINSRKRYSITLCLVIVSLMRVMGFSQLVQRLHPHAADKENSGQDKKPMAVATGNC